MCEQCRVAEFMFLNNKKPYVDYLQSEHWKILREKKLASVPIKRCAYCGSTVNLHIHHLKYKNLFDVKAKDLRILCSDCHKLTHKLIKEKKIHSTSFEIARKEVLKIKNTS